MSAYKDNSQGHGFIYVDVGLLLKQKDQLKSTPECHPQENLVCALHFSTKHKMTVSNQHLLNAMPERMEQIKTNLLQQLTGKLNRMRDELSDIRRKKK